MGDSGYPEYDNNRLNFCARVAARLQVRYSQKNAEKYNEATFTLQAVQDAVRQLDKTESSIAQEKLATPPEQAKVVGDFARALSPSYFVAERSTKSQANIAEKYIRFAFARSESPATAA